MGRLQYPPTFDSARCSNQNHYRWKARRAGRSPRNTLEYVGSQSLTPSQRGWTLDVLNAVRSLGKTEFDLAEVYKSDGKLAKLHPANRHVREKIRQQLQVLRDLGLLEFLGDGEYRLR